MYKLYFKRWMDIMAAILTLPLLLLVIFIVGILIKLEDNGPIIYKSKRLGKNGIPFLMYKFRSMKVNAPDIRNEDGSTFNSENDLRVTKIGQFIRKTSIDELPQLLNVLFGNMSFVGPRPDLLDQISLYKGNEIRKLEVLPGLTGYNQAYFRNSIPLKEKFENDIYYVDHISFFFDLKIIFKTIAILIHRKHVYTNNDKSIGR